jgi:murein DD-endopeptidase MepM/ murein hydrolase activator NlpD
MKKEKFYYNSHTLRYEKVVLPWYHKLLRIAGFIAAALVSALVIISFAFQYFDSPKEKILRLQYEQSKQQMVFLQRKTQELDRRLNELETRDNEVYRSIFEADPLPDSTRQKQNEKEKQARIIASMDGDELINSIVNSLNSMVTRTRHQEESYKEIGMMIKGKEKLLAATPAIQPVGNKNLRRLASFFGTRIDPMYKTAKFHTGLDFSAPQGTPVYATADGRITTAGNSGNGFGNHVVISHGFGYETLYGHMYKIKARAGQMVKRGQVIGWVGSTGKSTGPHLHYEVHKSGRFLDPIYFFYNDLSPDEYQTMLKMATSNNQSFD